MATIQRRRTAAGRERFRVLVRRQSGPTQSATFDTAEEAARWASATEGHHGPGSYRPLVPYTVAEAIDRYVEEELPTLKPGTVRFKRQILEWWKGRIGHCNLNQITPGEITRFRNSLRETHQPETVNHYVTHLGVVMRLACDVWGWVERYPMKGVRKYKLAARRVRFLTLEEKNRLLAYCQEAQNPDLYVAVVLGLCTGGRRMELLSLAWRDIEWDRYRLTFRQTKTDKMRSVPLVDPARTLLLERYHRASGTGREWVFPHQTKPTHQKRLWDCWWKVVERAGLEDFRFHDLRHTAASYMIMAGAGLVEVAEVLGHTKLQTTQRYTHLLETHSREVLNRMSSLLQLS